MTNRAQVEALADHYRLNQDGFLSEEKYNESIKSNELIVCRAKVLEEIDTIRKWVRKFSRRTTINRAATVTVLRLRAEAETGLSVSSGVFIVACLLEDIQVHRNQFDSADGFTNLSFKLTADP